MACALGATATGGQHLDVKQVQVQLAAGDHGDAELRAERLVQCTQRAHEQLAVAHNCIVGRLRRGVRRRGGSRARGCDVCWPPCTQQG